MNRPNLPTIKVESVPAADEEKWKALVGKNLGSEVERLYRDDTDLQIFEPAQLAREGLEQAVQLFNAELSEKDKKKAFESNKLQTFEDVAETVKAAAEVWATRKRHFPQVQDKLLSFLRSMGHYQNVLAIFPSQSQYTSTFCAALKVLITAATNYKETADGLTEALLEITAAAKNVSDLHGLFHTSEMRSNVIIFYASVLRLFWVAINWYQSKARRILGNFKDNLYAEIREIVTTIKTHAETVKDAAAKGSMAETRVMHLKFDHQGAILRQGLEELKNQAWANHLFLIWAYQNQQVQNRGSRRSNSRRGRRLLSKSPGRKLSSKALSDSEDESKGKSNPKVLKVYPRTETIAYAQKAFSLVGYDPQRVLKACINNRGKGFTPPGKQFRERLSSWMTGNCSSLLLIRGDASTQKISTITSFTAQLIKSASFANIQAVFYLCTFHPWESEAKPLIAMIQSLTLQVLEIEKREFETEADLSEARFRRVHDSFDAAWELFEDVISLDPARNVLIAIDCLERFDSDKDCRLLTQRLKSLAANGTKGNVKILLTSKRKTTDIFNDLPVEAELRLKTTRQTGNRGRQSMIGVPGQWNQRSAVDHTSAESTDMEDQNESAESSEADADGANRRGRMGFSMDTTSEDDKDEDSD